MSTQKINLPPRFAESESLAEAYRRGQEAARSSPEPLKFAASLDVELAYLAGGLDALAAMPDQQLAPVHA
jgi:hypothetical protein